MQIEMQTPPTKAKARLRSKDANPAPPKRYCFYYGDSEDEEDEQKTADPHVGIDDLPDEILAMILASVEPLMRPVLPFVSPRWRDVFADIIARRSRDKPTRRMERYPASYTALAGANYAAALAGAGYTDTLMWAQKIGCPCDKRVCSEAAGEGHFALLARARYRGCPWDEETCFSAAGRGHTDILVWATNNGCPWDSGATYHALKRLGDPNTIKWANSVMCPRRLARW
nr:F-box domain containing protein [Pandoravirus aubagnensis]